MKTPDHWQNFRDLAYWEKKGGGPDPYLACAGTVAWMNQRSLLHTAWFGALYLHTYNVPGALAIFEKFPDPEDLAGDFEWVKKNWDGLGIRKERRAVRTVEKFTRGLRSWAKLVQHIPTTIPQWNRIKNPEERFRFAFKDVCEVYGVGRYIAPKYVEFLRRYCGSTAQAYDVLAKDGWGPRTGLSYLFPDYADALLEGGEGADVVALTERLANQALDRLADEYGLALDHYELQVLLCNYKSAWENRTRYPGGAHDAEEDCALKIELHWGDRFTQDMRAARAKLFPPEVLGEVGGWRGIREGLGATLRDKGYLWNDFEYVYSISKGDLSKPKRR